MIIQTVTAGTVTLVKPKAPPSITSLTSLSYHYHHLRTCAKKCAVRCATEIWGFLQAKLLVFAGFSEKHGYFAEYITKTLNPRHYVQYINKRDADDIENESTLEEEETNEKDVKYEEETYYGKVTGLHNGYGLINEHIYFDFDSFGGLRPQIGTSVCVTAIKKGLGEHGGWVAKRVTLWEDWGSNEENLEKVNVEDCKDCYRTSFVGKVTRVEERRAVINDEVEFDLCLGEEGFVAVVGDWVTAHLVCSEALRVEKVVGVSPLRTRQMEGFVTGVGNEYGDIGKEVYFRTQILNGNRQLRCRDRVIAIVVESSFKKYSWRATSIVPAFRTKKDPIKEKTIRDDPVANLPLRQLIQDKHGVTVTSPTDFGILDLNGAASIKIDIRNEGSESQTLQSFQLLSSANQQFSCRTAFVDALVRPVTLETGGSVGFLATCHPSILGKSSQMLVFNFDGFVIGRLLTVNVQSSGDLFLRPSQPYVDLSSNDQSRPLSVSLSNTTWVIPGQRPIRNTSNARWRKSVKLLQYQVPEELWDCVLQDRDLLRLEPCLAKPLNEADYKSKLNTLLHLEEIQMELELRQYSLRDVVLEFKYQYLALEVPGVVEGRPSLIIGDVVVVTNSVDHREDKPHFEGCIHEISDTTLYLMFHPSFHQNYVEGSPMDVYFKLSRTPMRRCHQSVQMSDILGPSVLLPRDVGHTLKRPQVRFFDEDDHVTQSQCRYCRTETSTPSSSTPSSPTPSVQKCQQSPTGSAKKRRQTVVDRLFGDKLVNNEKPEVGSRDREDVVDGGRNGICKHLVDGVAEGVKGMKMADCGCLGNSARTTSDEVELRWFNGSLNRRQKDAVRRILRGLARPVPYVVFGPPGTGKTMTVIEAILQIHHLCRKSRILVTAPSNSAADLLAERLHLSGQVNQATMIRINAYQRVRSSIPEAIRDYCVNCDELDVSARHKIVVCTCTTAGAMHALELPAEHFTHVFVDEAGQATEPECLIPILFVGPTGQIILAGDPEQLGPVLRSRLSISYGLSTSLLERLMQRPVYMRDVRKFEGDSYDPLLVTKLLDNYRSHPSILSIPSRLFYDDELNPVVDLSTIALHCGCSILPSSADVRIFFHGVEGEELREETNPSWFNAVEVMQVMKYLRMLYDDAKLVAEDIGIVTPYRKQVEKIRLMISSLEMATPKVGSTEEFQGQERLVIIISTVRSGTDTDKSIRNLGFLGNKKRFNVSVTRAKALLIIIGNPFVLAEDVNWREMLLYCVRHGSYVGCDLPSLQK